MAPARRPSASLALVAIALAVSGGAALGYASGRAPGGDALRETVGASAAVSAPSAAEPSAGPSPTLGLSAAGAGQPGADPAACTYADEPSRTPEPASSAPISAGAVVRVTGVLSAEGWVPPPGATCPPEP
jgi:hypothetical protein